MVLDDAFGTNSLSNLDRGLEKSLIDSTIFNASLENSSDLLGLSKVNRNISGFDPLSLVANSLATGNSTTDNNNSNLQQDISTNNNSPVDYTFEPSPLFNGQSFSSLSPKQPESATLDSATGFDLLTGKTNDAPNIGIAASDSLLVGGNNSSSLLALLPDIIPPALTVTVLPLSIIPGSPQAHLVGIVNGTGSAVASLTLQFDNLAAGPISVSPTGVFDKQLDFTGLNNGSHTLKVNAADVAGNVSTANFSVTLNLAPTPPTITAGLTNDTAAGGTINTDGITSDPTTAGIIKSSNRSIEFNALTGSTPLVNLTDHILINETNQIVSLKAGFDNTSVANYADVLTDLHSDGSFTLSRTRLNTIYGSILPNGNHTLHLQAVDKYGVANSFNISFTLDTTTAIPTLNLSAASDSGKSNADRITLDTTPTINGTAEALATVKLFNNSQLLGQTTATTNGNWQITTSELTDGVYNFNATVTDIAGNASTSVTALAVTIDSTLPQVNLTTSVDQSPLHLGDKLTGSVNGTGSAVTGLSYRFDNRQEVSVNFSSTGSFDQALDLMGLSNGEHALTITATDTAGNVKITQYNVTVFVDRDPPVISAALLHDTAPSEQSNTDRITFDPTISGTVTDISQIIEFRAGFDNTAVANFVNVLPLRQNDGTFRFDRTQLESIYGGTLPDGDRVLHLLVVDQYGNTSNIFDFNFTLDTIAPTVSLTTPNSVGDYSNTARLIGSASDIGGRATSAGYSIDGQAFSSLAVDNQGQFNQEIATSGLTTGSHNTVIQIFDTAGNSTQTVANFTVSNDFLVGATGTQGWGNKTANSVTLGEQNSFVTQTAIPIALGQTQGKRQLEFDISTLFDTTNTTAASKDRLAVYLVDPTNPKVTLLDRGEPGTALFSLDETGAEFTPGLVNYNGNRVQVDLTSLANKTSASLVFQLINNDGDTGSVVQVQNLTNIVDPEGVSSPIFPTGTDKATIGSALNLGNFTTALNAKLLVSNVHLDSATGRYTADLQARNIGTTTLSRQLVVVLTNLPAGVSLLNPSGVHAAGSPYINLTNAIRPGGLAPGAISDTVQVVFDDPSLLRFALQAVFLKGSPEQGPLLQNPGSLNVKPGERLAIPLTASDANGDPITFSLRSDKPLPKGELSGDGILVFNPSPEQVGTYNFTVVASSGSAETTQDVILTVTADAVTTTRISGVIQNTNQAPLAGVTIEVGGTQTVTAADGSFKLEFSGALPDDKLKVHGEQVSGTATYPFIAEKLPLLLGHNVYSSVNNVISRPIYLPPLDTANAQTIDPNVNETVTSTTIPGSAVFVAAGTLKNQQGNPFTGKLSITEVPTNLTPAALPENLHPDLVVTIQPGEMVFTTPAPLTLPNRAGYAPGLEMDLWSINPTTGFFDNVGTGKVSADGSVIQTISGGIRNSSWHFFALPPGVFGTLKDVNKDPRNPDEKCNKCKATESINSEVELHSGAVQETHDLITYQSLGETRGLTLKYNSLRADPRPIVHFGYDNVQLVNTTGGLLIAKLAVKQGDFTYQVPGIAQGQYGLSGGEHFWSLPDTGGTADAALEADLRSLPSGQYTYELTTGLFTSSFNGSSTTSTGKLINVNTINSSFGSGWGLAGLQEIVENEDGSALLIDGDGSQLLFEAPTTANSSYASPAGDTSTLVRLADGTFHRTMKDQTIYNFNAENKLELVRDRNGNETQYVYNTAGQLTQMIDPVGLATTFTYTGSKITSITDPANRITQMEYDSKGNLIKITDPDNSAKRWEYDNEHHVTAAVDKMGNRGEDFYDFAGRVTRGVRPDGSVVQVNPVEVQGLYRPEQTLNPLSAPVTKDLGAAVASYADGNGNVVRTLLDSSGQTISSTDGAGLMPTVERDANNRVTKSTDGRGYVTNYTYDSKGNVLTIKDELSQSSPGSGNSAKNTLFPNPIYKTGNSPQQILTADLNQDGFLDLVSANSSNSSVSVLFGEEQGTFSAPTNVAIGSNPKSLAVGDVNGDGKVDLVMTNFSSNDVLVLLGNGQGTFSTPTPANLAFETRPDSIALGDLDADGDLDLIVGIVNYTMGYGSDNVTVLLNNGNGTFGTKTNYALQSKAQYIAVGDVNGDGKVDLVTANSSRNNASVLYGDGQGRFSVPSNLDLGSTPDSIALGDLDADGDLDFVFVDSSFGYGSDTLSILLNNGNGTFSPKTNYALNNQVQSIAVADVNKDGKLDLMIASSYSDNVSVLLNNGDGTFAAKTDYAAGNRPSSIVLGDVNGDSTVDLLSSNTYSNTVSVRLGNGDGTFSPLVNNYTVGSGPESVALGDVNSDGRLDLVVANSGYGSDVLSVLLNNGDGSFSAKTDYTVGSNPKSVALGDVNSDGRLDLVSANYDDSSVSVLLGNGNGTFAAKVDYLVGSGPSSIALGDVNSDGRLDLVSANYDDSSVSVLLGNGNGTFAAKVDYAAGTQASFVVLKDLNSDGRVDLVTTDYYGVSVLLNNNGTFTSKTNYEVGINLKSVAVGDANSDGYLDLLTTNFDDDSVSVLLGNGTGVFNPQKRLEFAVGDGPSSIALNDLDADGDLDFVTANYNGNNVSVRLNSTIQPGVSSGIGERRYTYDPIFNQVTSETDELGRKTLYEIDPLTGNLLSTNRVVGAVGGDDDVVTRYAYTTKGQIDTTTDALGRVTDYDYNAFGELIKTTFAKGTVDEASQQFEYDAAGNQTAIIDELGHRTEFVYDPMNQLLKTIEADPDGTGALTSPVTTYAYDKEGNQTLVTDARNNVMTSDYDNMGHLVKTTDAKGNVTRYTYDKAGNQILEVDALGRETKTFYEARNRLIERIYTDGSIYKPKYDFDDNLTSDIDAKGNRTNKVYDARGRLIREIDALGNVTRSEYDASDQLVATIDANGNKTRYKYDDLGRQVEVIDALGHITKTEYNKVGNVVGNTDALGHTTRYTYDNLDRQTAVTDNRGKTITTQYDAVGNVTATTDQLQRKIQFTYDALNRQTSVTDPLNYATTYTYDASDNLIAETDALNRKTQYSYDALNRRIGITNALGGTSTTTYDAVGNTIAVTDELGRTTKLTYDKRDRLIETTDPLNHKTTREYDSENNLIAVTDALGHKTRYGYDALNRQTTITDAKNQTTTTTYDGVGKVSTITDSVGNITTYTYDVLNRAIAEKNQQGKTRFYEYDAVGNRTAAIDRNERKRTFTYDDLNRLYEEKWLDTSRNSSRTISYGYDAANQLTTTSDPDSSYTYTYDAAGQLAKVDNVGTPSVTRVIFGYTYDAVGNRLSVTDTINGTERGTQAFTYDALNRVTRITQSGNGVTAKRVDMGYDFASQLKNITRYADLGDTQLVAGSSYIYDNAGRLTNLTHKRGTTNLAGYTLDYDAANRITKFTSSDGTSDYNYDDTNQLTGSDHSFQTDEAYSYDANGNRTNTGYQTGVDNKLQSDGKYNYEYDFEGNRTKRTEIATGEITEYVWDYRNRLTQVVTKNVGNITKQANYTYDVGNQRITKLVDADGAGSAAATVEIFVYDNEHIALTFDGNGTQTHRYLYGTQIDQILADENGQGQVLWALTDNQGSVRDLVNSTGTIQNHITYDSFGKITQQTNPSVNIRFGYTGRDFDAETGLNYYRARYYDSANGQFISQDPIGFNGNDTNLYRYVVNSPTNGVDPTGLLPGILKDLLQLLRRTPGSPIPPIFIPDSVLDELLPQKTIPLEKEVHYLEPKTQNPNSKKVPAPIPNPEAIKERIEQAPKPDPNCPDKCPKRTPTFIIDGGGEQTPNHARMVSAALRLEPKWKTLTYKYIPQNKQTKARSVAIQYWTDTYGAATTYGYRTRTGDGRGIKIANYNWDEYPYFRSYEGGLGASYAELVKESENKSVGGRLGNFFRQQLANGDTSKLPQKDGCKYNVQVINYKFNPNNMNDIPDFIGDSLYEKLYPQLKFFV
ncbi:MAG: FG-GAP-like repeat-containing protein [Nostoc sp.]|uniref:FG-GAP-like repeat-containing protein n=1 Tax=Nostoc sp. TaxID=1180 RepID=UPI002FFA1246